MQEEIRNFIQYMTETKHAAGNTVISYERDLKKMSKFLEEQGIPTVDRVTTTALNMYILFLERSGMSSATISRAVATMRRFYDFQFKHGSCHQDPSELLKGPRVEKKQTSTLTHADRKKMLGDVGTKPKQLRDKAMVLAMAEGVKASEIISLKMADLNLNLGYLTLRGERHTRTMPMSQSLKEALKTYLEKGREDMLQGRQSENLFLNCSGTPLTRQGVWKMVKGYGEKMGIPGLTPDRLRIPVQS
jgi:integrase/recombinase XerD